MSHKQQYEATDLDYGTENFRTAERFDSANRKRPEMGRKRGKTPQSFNGMHRRRRRKRAWYLRPGPKALAAHLLCARADETLRGDCAVILRGRQATNREQFGNTGKRLTLRPVRASHRSMIVCAC
jgi:hypothetical protein